MHILKPNLCRIFSRIPMLFGVFVFCSLFTESAHAESSLLDAFNLAPFVPLVLETMMNIATALYKYFVGNGTGLIYIFIYLFLGFYLGLYAFKMFIPKDWLSFLGFTTDDSIWDGKNTTWSVIENVLKPCLRAIVAGLVLLQIKPVYVTEWLVNPFLEFGAIYTDSILTTLNQSPSAAADAPLCPPSIAEKGWISESSCNFLIQPVYTISKENNRVIEYGFNFLKSGFIGMLNLIPRGGQDFLNLVTGVVLITSFVASNLFMALLIIQGIFEFCLALIMYPFKVLTWVAKKSDKWIDVLPVFDQIINALKKLVITMIACAFILCINIAIVHALFNWSSPMLIAESGVVDAPVADGFGQHSILWISAILTFFLMRAIFNTTQERLDRYSGVSQKSAFLYNDVMATGKRTWEKLRATPTAIQKIIEGTKKK